MGKDKQKEINLILSCAKSREEAIDLIYQNEYAKSRQEAGKIVDRMNGGKIC